MESSGFFPPDHIPVSDFLDSAVKALYCNPTLMKWAVRHALCQKLLSPHTAGHKTSSNCTELQPIGKVTGQWSHTESAIANNET